MLQLLLSLLGLSLLDCLNPATIATLILLLPMVKKVSHSSIFIWGTFIVYFTIGVSFYYGIDKFIKSFVIEVITKNTHTLSILGIIMGMILLGIAVRLAINILKTFNKNEDVKEVNMIKIKNVGPKALIILSIVSTLSDAPTAVPYIGFISKLLGMDLSFLGVVLMLLVYCFIYILPMLILYLSYQKLKDKFEKIVSKTKNLINKFNVYVIPVMCFIGGVWILIISFIALYH